MSAHTTHTAGIGEQAGILLFSQWQEIEHQRTLVLKHGDVDAIHDLRVATRRMRATIALIAPLISGKGLRFIVRAIRKLTRALGAVRTIDEAIIYTAPCSEAVPVLTAVLGMVRSRELVAVIAALERLPRHAIDRRLRKSVSRLAVLPHDRSVAGHLEAVSTGRFQAIHDLLLPASHPERVEIRHALRIAVKKWRYSLETLAQLCGRDYVATLEALKEYQTVLGKLNDFAEFRALCDSMDLPLDEVEELRVILDRDTRMYLDRFLGMAASHPLQYPTTP